MRVARLGEIVSIKGGGTPDRSVESYWNGDIPWASVKDFKDIEIAKTQEFVSSEGVRNSSANVVPAGTILVPTRMAVGKAAVAKMDLAINQDLKALTPSAEVNTRYLLRALLANGPSLERMATGATVKGITLEVLKDLQIPLPPLPEQKRIAAILDQADELRRKRKQAIECLNQLGQAIFYEMFGEFLHAASRKKATRRLIELADISSGVTKGRKLGVEPTRELPYMAVVNVQDKFLALENVKTIEATESEIKRYLLKKGDLLLTEGGDPDKLGRGVLWNDELAECIHQNHIFRVRVTSSELNPVFLNWLVASPSGKDYFLRSSKQTTGIASINKTQLGEFPVALPSKTDQKVFAERLTRIKSQTELARIGHLNIDALFQSLQSRAFAGAL